MLDEESEYRKLPEEKDVHLANGTVRNNRAMRHVLSLELDIALACPRTLI